MRQRARREQGAKLCDCDPAADTGACGGVGAVGMSVIQKTMKKISALICFVFSSVITCVAFAQTSISVVSTVTVTRLVETSTAPIDEPFPTVNNLPKTISFDSMSEAEMQQWHQEMFDYNIRVSAGRSGGGTSCTQWYLLRLGQNQPWKTVGVGGLIKINGIFRSVVMDYSIDAGKSIWVSGKQVPGKEPGSGGGFVNAFKKKQTSFAQELNKYTDGDKNVPSSSTDLNDSKITRSFLNGDFGSEVRQLIFGQTEKLTVLEKKMKCSNVNANCRRYIFPFVNASWRGFRNDAREPISFPLNASYEMAIEDMCPFDRGALVQREINTRLGGPGPGVRSYGFPKNTHLTESIRPYLEQVKK